MFILGVNAYHGDSSACLLKDGIMLAAAEEERFRRIKHWAGIPTNSIDYCLAQAGITLNDVDHIAINQDGKANLGKKFSYMVAKRPDFKSLLNRLNNKRDRSNLVDQLNLYYPLHKFKGCFHNIEHHLAHLSSAFHVSPFEEAVVVSVDGFGDFASAAWGVGRGTEIVLEDKVYFPHSLGIFYQALTQFIGFPNYGDEYKVMGLAPYGQPNYVDQMRQIVMLRSDGTFELNLKYFLHHAGKVEMEWDNDTPSIGTLFSSELENLLGPRRQNHHALEQYHKDIAHSVQVMYEEAFFHLLNSLHERHKLDSIAVAGGCGMNSVANGKIRLCTPFEKVYVQSAAGDAGGAIGAAMSVWYQLIGKDSKRSKSSTHDHAYWGPEFSNEEIGHVIDTHRVVINYENCTIEQQNDLVALCKQIASYIAKGDVVGWFQGRMEWGPRALGNRSILGDPRRADMKDILNLKIKRRESFRPFAPSVLQSDVSEWFEQDDDVPFMMQVYQIRPHKREIIPAVTHVDGSGRLQTVYQHTNPRYHSLITAFKTLTGVPMVLNTSFNENEPVVCTPKEALDCFLRTKMDVLVLGNWVVRRGG